MKIKVRPRENDDDDWITEGLVDSWASNIVVTRGISYKADLLPGFIAEIDGIRMGLLTYNVNNNELEIITLNAIEEGKGIEKFEFERIERTV